MQLAQFILAVAFMVGLFLLIVCTVGVDGAKRYETIERFEQGFVAGLAVLFVAGIALSIICLIKGAY